MRAWAQRAELGWWGAQARPAGPALRAAMLACSSSSRDRASAPGSSPGGARAAVPGLGRRGAVGVRTRVCFSQAGAREGRAPNVSEVTLPAAPGTLLGSPEVSCGPRKVTLRAAEALLAAHRRVPRSAGRASPHTLALDPPAFSRDP